MPTNPTHVGGPGAQGTLVLYPPNKAGGTTEVLMPDNTGDTKTTVTFAAQAAASTITIPDLGTAWSFVGTAGAQTIAGAKTFSDAATFSAAVTFSSTTGFTGAITPTGGVAAAGGFTFAPRLCHTGGVPVMVSTDGTNATPSATETYIGEIFVPANCTLTGIAVLNGATVGTDKHFLALANSAGTVVANTATAGTTTSGADAYQRIPFTATYAVKGPATYYVCLQMNGTTDRYNAHPIGNFGASKGTGTTFGTLASVTPPTTFTADLAPIASLY